MTWRLLQLAFPIVFIGIAFYFYRSHRDLLVYFRKQMAVSPAGRRFIVLATMLVLIVYHFVALCGTSGVLELLPSSIWVGLMFSQKYGESIIRFFQGRRNRYCAFVLILAAFFLPATTPMAVTMMVLLVTSWILPTKEEMDAACERGDIPDIIGETVEGLTNEMLAIHARMFPEEVDDAEEVSDVDTETIHAESLDEPEMVEDVNDVSSPSNSPSERAIHNQEMREKERKHRHSRAKRRARRAKNGR